MANDADVVAIQATVNREITAVTEGDPEKYFSVLDADAFFMAPNQPIRSGQSLREWLRGFLQAFSIEWLQFHSIDTRIDTHLAYHIFTYHWRATPRSGGTPTQAQGKGLHILTRHDDGTWKILREIWNATPGAPDDL